MSKYEDVEVICPYFVKFFRNSSIKCESQVPGFKGILQKKNRVQVRDYAIKYCCSYEYFKCPYAAMMIKEDMRNEQKRASLHDTV